jgi:hypothetical protein
VDKFPPAQDDVVHVEDGAWVNKDGDFGSPRMIGWNWPLWKENFTSIVDKYDPTSGWSVDQRNWAVITAGLNFVQTAAAVGGGVRPAEVQLPSSSATDAEIAWNLFLPSVTSGYMYYGAILDMADKQSVACNAAIEYAKKAIGDEAKETVPPSVWYLFRQPYNPGGFGMGAEYNYKYTKMPSDFYVYTFAFDVSGVKNSTLYVRKDSDGENPLTDDANELFEPRPEHTNAVGPWKPWPMTRRILPATDHKVKFNFPPTAIAEEFYAHLKGFRRVLLDYYVRSCDVHGNCANTDIHHVYVG